jgi:biotin carboxylase
MKSILFIGIGDIGLNQIKWAKEAGFNTIVTDKSKNASSFKIADDYIIADGSDSKKIINEINRKYKKRNIQAIYTGSDFGILTSAIINQHLNLPACSVKAASASIDKIKMKKYWEIDKISTPKYSIINSNNDVSRIINSMKTPVVIKPSSSSGSQGVSIVHNKNDFKKVYKEALKYSNGDPIIIEEEIKGTHIDANGLFWKNRFYPCGTSQRYFSEPPYTVPLRGHEPGINDSEIKNNLYKIFENAGRSLGIDNSPVKADFIISKNKPIIIELSARFHGDLGLSHNSYYRTGMSPSMIYFETLKSGEVPLNKLKLYLNNNNYSAWSIINLKPGLVNNLDEAINAAKQMVKVDNVFIDSRKGSKFNNLQNNNDVNGFVWVSGTNLEKINKKINKFCTYLQKLIQYN